MRILDHHRIASRDGQHVHIARLVAASGCRSRGGSGGSADGTGGRRPPAPTPAHGPRQAAAPPVPMPPPPKAAAHATPARAAAAPARPPADGGHRAAHRARTPPVALEVEGASAALVAAEVEAGASMSAGMAQQGEIEKIIGHQSAIAPHPTRLAIMATGAKPRNLALCRQEVGVGAGPGGVACHKGVSCSGPADSAALSVPGGERP